MIPFLNNRLANILLVGSHSASLLLWRKSRLQLSARYELSDEGLAAFEAALPSLKNTDFTLVMDVIEEDFRSDSIPHVGGADRSALLTRKLNQLFRSTPYKTARVVGREKTGRKDDKVFLTALTKPEILDPWLKCILAKGIPVRAISSSAYLMEKLARYQHLHTKEHVLLVNVEEAVGVRQTYLQKGRVVFSRLTPASVQRTDSFAEFIVEESTQTRKYLERIKQLSYDVNLDVHVFTALPQTELGELKRDLLNFHFTTIADLSNNFALAEQGAAPGALAYSLARSLKQGALANVYAPLMSLRYFYIGKLRQGLYLATAMVLLASLWLIYPGVMTILDDLQSTESLQTQTLNVRADYSALRARFPETPIPSGKMELVVETYDRIAAQVIDLNHILDVIGRTALVSPALTLTQIAWELQELPDEGAVDMMYAGLAPDNPEVALMKTVAAGRTVPVITLQGVVTSAGSRREARERVLAFVAALAQLSGLTVTPLTMPLDLNSASNIKTRLDGSSLAEDFVLELRPQVTTP